MAKLQENAVAILSFIINAIAVLMVADGIFILIYPKHIEQLAKEVFPKLSIRKVAIVELIAGLSILALRTAGNLLL